MSNRNFISIVISAYNEEANIAELYKQLKQSLDTIDSLKYEIIFVNDGSKDNTKAEVLKLYEKDKDVKLVDFVRNFGHEIAMTAGMDYAVGDAVLFMDADLQHPPQLIPEMVKHWRDGVDIVLTKRVDNQQESYFQKLRGKIFYKILNKLSDFEIPAQTPDFRLIDRKYVEVVKSMKENNRMFRGLISWIGVSNQVVIDFEAPSRFAGESKYSVKKLMKLAVDSILSFSIKPLRFAMYFGIISIIISGLVGVYMIIDYLITPNYQTTGFATTALLVIFLGSVQLISLGVIGEYVGRIHIETKNRPLYIAQYFPNQVD
ncbi:MAG: glycosyltransferase family 2 protein [Lentimicrobiaceae bacterium]|nr:glycosyltransferase family 2 protein [Lentimicrobiaceae bacterium]